MRDGLTMRLLSFRKLENARYLTETSLCVVCIETALKVSFTKEERGYAGTCRAQRILSRCYRIIYVHKACMARMSWCSRSDNRVTRESAARRMPDA